MNITILVDYKGYFRQGMSQYISMDLEKIKFYFSEKGYLAEIFSYEEVVNQKISLKNRNIIYTSSENQLYKSYIDDVLYSLSTENQLIPKYEYFKAHENKGFQELLKEKLNIKSLEWSYFGNVSSISLEYTLKMRYPLVLKTVMGAGSSGVFLVNNLDQLLTVAKKVNRENFKYKMLKKVVKQVFNKIFFLKKFSMLQYQEDPYMGRFILQEFMEKLHDDWKVLVFDTKFYVLNRRVRDNDFRASGSGKLSYIDPPIEVLEFAKEIYHKLNVPFVSFDIGFNGEQCSLIEFQCVHFGPYTIVNSEFYYIWDNGSWEKRNEKSILEEELVNSVCSHIDRLG